VPAAVRVAPDSATLLSLGDTLTLRATVTDASGRTLTTATPTWRSTSPAIASVSAGGTVTALTNGEAMIEASVGALTASTRVLVAQRPSAVTLLRDTLPLVIGRSRPLVATVRDARGQSIAGASLRWRSAAPSVLAVDSTGVVTGVAIGGPGYVIASSGAVSDSLGLRVRSVPAATVTIGLTRSEFNIGDTLRLAAVVRDSAGTVLADARPSWSVEQPLVARVDSTGRLAAVGTGRTRVVATIPGDGVRAEAEVVVRGLIHRWRFDETGGAGTVFQDDIRGALARLVDGGPNEGVAVGGVVTLAGGHRDSSDYVSLPSTLLDSARSATIELWATTHAVRRWSRVFDIGRSAGHSVFIAWSQDLQPNRNRSAFALGGREDRLDDVLAPFERDRPHHIVMAISDSGAPDGRTRVRLYRDGVLRGAFDTPHRLAALGATQAWLGRSFFGDETASASYYELRVHDRVYSDTEIGLMYRSSVPEPDGGATLRIIPPEGLSGRLRGIGSRVRLRAELRDVSNRPFPVTGIAWTSETPAVVRVDSSGEVTTLAAGNATVVASAAGRTARLTLPVVHLERIPVAAREATPAPGAQWEVPVMLIAYVPTADGTRVDVRKAPDFWSLNPVPLDTIEQRCLDYASRRKMMAEEASRFRGSRNPLAAPALGYRIIEQVFVWSTTPGSPKRNAAQDIFPDYRRIYEETNAMRMVPERRVKEVWLCESGFGRAFPSFDPALHDPADFRTGWESNMASPSSGDISNSDRDPNDLPVFAHTHILYGINFRRSQAEAMHNVGHQLEAMLSWANWRQDGNSHLFWRRFVGQDDAGNFVTGRAGWTHMPPNTTGNYDYHNPALVQADIEDWRPDGLGTRTAVSNRTWSQLAFPWPGAQQFGQREESQWYVYWMQNMPGRGNRIPHPSGGWMTNWWAFVGDWDGAVRSGLGLYGNTPSETIRESIGAASSVRAHGPNDIEPGLDRWPVKETRRPPR
jgi:uncharacterized protein YjdB